MAIILKIDNENGNTFILEALDDETCLVQASKIEELKYRLKEASNELPYTPTLSIYVYQTHYVLDP